MPPLSARPAVATVYSASRGDVEIIVTFIIIVTLLASTRAHLFADNFFAVPITSVLGPPHLCSLLCVVLKKDPQHVVLPAVPAGSALHRCSRAAIQFAHAPRSLHTFGLARCSAQPVSPRNPARARVDVVRTSRHVQRPLVAHAPAPPRMRELSGPSNEEV
jgi:hypothetical protein